MPGLFMRLKTRKEQIMALTTCKTCSKGISDTAIVCPHCGEKYPHGIGPAAAQTAAPILGILLGLIILLAFISQSC
jgi:hypothetical protein